MYIEYIVPLDICQPSSCEYHDSHAAHLGCLQGSLNLLLLFALEIICYQSRAHNLGYAHAYTQNRPHY